MDETKQEIGLLEVECAVQGRVLDWRGTDSVRSDSLCMHLLAYITSKSDNNKDVLYRLKQTWDSLPWYKRVLCDKVRRALPLHRPETFDLVTKDEILESVNPSGSGDKKYRDAVVVEALNHMVAAGALKSVAVFEGKGFWAYRPTQLGRSLVGNRLN